jgi:type I restriction enzyme, S subunit
VPKNWSEWTVENIKSSAPNALATGPFGSAISSKYFVDSGVPVLRGGNLSQDVGVRLNDEDLVFLSPEPPRVL